MCYQLPWLQIFFILFSLTILYPIFISCSSTPQLSYTDHCGTIVPESTQLSSIPLSYAASTFPQFLHGYYSGGDSILGRNSNSPPSSLKYVAFFPSTVYKTDDEGVFMVKGSATFRRYYTFQNYTRGQSYYSGRVVPYRSRSRFELRGFWSETSGKLCMVGSGSTYSKEGNILDLIAVSKLNFVKNSSILVSGTLESLSSANDSNYFEPISILLFTRIDTSKNSTMVSKEFDSGYSDGSDISQSLPLDLTSRRRLCSILSKHINEFELNYRSYCNSAKNCTPFDGNVENLPRALSFNALQCSDYNQRVLVEFHNNTRGEYYRGFSPNTTLVGEGLWDVKKNELCIVACQILNASDSLAYAHVGDCSIRLSLRFPAIWSIRDRRSIVGKVWSNKTVNDSGYFESIKFQSSENVLVGIPGIRYGYTEVDKIRKACTTNKTPKNKGLRYPSGYSYDLRFDMSVRYSKGRFAWGYSAPLFVGDLVYDRTVYSTPISRAHMGNSVVNGNTSIISPLNISYKISFTLLPGVKLSGGISSFNISLSPNMQQDIAAEGIYDAHTGRLCMVGCRNLGSNSQISTDHSLDCEILMNVQFPPLNSKDNDGYIKGSIQSTRKISDPLYFERLDLSSTAFVASQATRSIWRMDVEITMVLISNTLACVFVGLQLFYVKKHPDMPSLTSFLMLLILTLGYMIPLMLNFEALFLRSHNQQHVLLGSGGWLEVNEVLVRVFTMVSFLLQFRLLQLTWSARWDDGSQKDLWATEKKALYVSLPLYVAGGLITLLVNWGRKNNGHVSTMSYPYTANYRRHSLLGDFKSYGGLVLDGFLLPQILLNVVWDLREKPLACSFYIGTTFVRLLPHAYDLYRSHSYVPQLAGSYIYANPGADFYSTYWDVIIPCGGLVLATVVYLQQRFGGRCFLPQRLGELKVYEKVPEVSNG